MDMGYVDSFAVVVVVVVVVENMILSFSAILDESRCFCLCMKGSCKASFYCPST